MHQKEELEKRMLQSDEYLLELAIAGDGGCFGELVERWQPRIFLFICRYVGNPEEAKDLTQNTFTKAFENLNRLSNTAHFSAWIYKIALNECRMGFRRRQRRPSVPFDESQAEVERTQKAVTPDLELESRERVRQVREVFQLLPKEQREVILMKEFEGLRFNDVAEILGIPVSTAKSRMYLGLRTLKRLMEGQYDL